ncbi:TRIC cation channel family protein [Micromonospora yasonensis]|uniref:trimeric intracellular cation channel family protein n=1 Tax=Micromonospora yasonensis TaxID=1128667 RepID=UPI00222E58A5|nr:TRIC cation channel family protein [Micromonospora yasonensis]MCW3841171.1 TRIC cation channel family protein [Micromonospora yasonensis]
MVTFFVHPVVRRLAFTVLVFDAAGLGLFCVTGTLKALDFHLGSLQAVLLGITTAVGGGVLRDITARDTDLPMPVVATGAAVLVFLFRIVAMLRHWTAPRAWQQPCSTT